LVKAGPAGIFVDYTVIGCVVFLVMAALGEMISFMPLSRMFSSHHFFHHNKG
jgi:amino acid transporter